MTVVVVIVGSPLGHDRGASLNFKLLHPSRERAHFAALGVGGCCPLDLDPGSFRAGVAMVS